MHTYMDRPKVTAEIIPKFSNTMAESLRAVRTNIQFCGDDVRTILITSTEPDEGKSTVTFDLGRSFAAAGNKVLIIDSDMRKSVFIGRYRFHRRDKEPIRGLSNYLSGQTPLTEVVCDTNIKNLSIVFSGRNVKNSTELLGKSYFTDLLKKARENFDYVLVDCAPMSVSIDATFISQYCDGAVYVIAQNTVSIRAVKECASQLEASGVRILGAVLNKVEMEKNRYYGYGYGYGKYYGKYYGYGSYGSDDDSRKNGKNG